MPRSESTRLGVLDRMIERFGTALTKPGEPLRRKTAPIVEKLRDYTAEQQITFAKEQVEQDQTSRLRGRGLPAKPKMA